MDFFSRSFCLLVCVLTISGVHNAKAEECTIPYIVSGAGCLYRNPYYILTTNSCRVPVASPSPYVESEVLVSAGNWYSVFVGLKWLPCNPPMPFQRLYTPLL